MAAIVAGAKISLRSVNYPDRYVRHSNFLGELTEVSSELDRKDATFTIRKGLAGGDSISFESVNYPGRFLRHENYRIKLHEPDGSDLFKNDASFTPRAGLSGSGTSFESVNYPGFYLRHCSFRLYIDDNRRDNSACDPTPRVYRQDVSFEVVPGLIRIGITGPTIEVAINGTTDAKARYISYTPSPCRIRQKGGTASLAVTLRSRPAQQGGGKAVFYSAPNAKASATLALDLPANGAWVDFWMGGQFKSPSVEDRDCLLRVTGDATAQVDLMVRVRKNANDLLPAERDRFLAAWGALNASGKGKFQDFRDMHVSGAADRQEHRGPQFLPWHRTYLLDLERELQAIDPSVSLHYWRFDQPAPKIFRGNFMGATTQGPAAPVQLDATNPLSGWVTDSSPGILRSALFDTQTSAAPGVPGFALISQADTLALGTTYRRFRGMEGTPHGAAHVSFRGDISDIATAPKDPLFFMLHANVDRLWALWQWVNKHTDPSDPNVYTGEDEDGRRLADTLWPWNGVVTPPRPNFAPRAAQGNQGGVASSPTTAAPGNVPTIQSVIDLQGHTTPPDQIGYSYDDVPYEFS